MHKKIFLLALVFTTLPFNNLAANVEQLMKKGWAELIKDNDSGAITCFELAYEAALKENDNENIANALLNLGLCYYGVSQTKGFEYCFSAMAYYQRLESKAPKAALNGRSRCLQLLSTIYNRQGKYWKSVSLSREALTGFIKNDGSGYVGLAYTSIGSAYAHLGKRDSAAWYFQKALQAQLNDKNFVYLPSAYVKLAEIELINRNPLLSHQLYARAGAIADSMGNKQAQVITNLGTGKWQLVFGKKDSAEVYYRKARSTAKKLRDQAFYVLALNELLQLKKQQNNFKAALELRDEIAVVTDSMISFDQRKLAKSLETQFNVAEKDRKLLLLQNDRDITLLSNYLLWGTIGFIIVVASGIIIFLRRINSRDKALLQTKEELVAAIASQKKIREKYLQNELEFKESQLSALAFQILQKNELMLELKSQLEENKNDPGDPVFKAIISKGLNLEKEWDDFNRYFTSINKNFYTRLKMAYPDISPNDLKISALIKLNLSIKEMAGILNISPDSVKTARYRLRKKLNMNTEDNLTDFILKL